MNGSLPPHYFYLPYEFRSDFEYSDFVVAKGGIPSWHFLPSYPSPPMSSPPSPQRKVSNSQSIPPSTFTEFTLPGTTTSDPTLSSTAPSIQSVVANVPSTRPQSLPQPFATSGVAGPSTVPRTYSSSSNESQPALYRTESVSSASHVPDTLAIAGPSTGAASPTLGSGSRRAKAHVANACSNCKRAHLSCDVDRPCGRCVATGKADTCHDVPHKKRGRPRLRDEGQFQIQPQGTLPAESTEVIPIANRPIAGGRHRRTGSLRTLHPQLGEPTGGHLMNPSSLVAPTQGHAVSVATGGFPPSLRQPRLAPSPEVPIAFLDTDFVVLKANTTFQRLFSWLQEIRGIRLTDIARPMENDSFQNARNRLREEREIREPAYLPPILQPRLDPVAGIGITDNDVDEVTRGYVDHQFSWTFRLGGGIDQTLPVRIRLAKTSVYFVTLFLPPLPPQVSVEHNPAPWPAPPPGMFHPSAGNFRASPRMVERQPGIAESSPAYYQHQSAGPVPNVYGTRTFPPPSEQQNHPHQQQHYTYQQPQPMLPPPTNPERRGSNVSSGGLSQQQSFLPSLQNRPRSQTIESLGRQVQRLRADSGATVPATFQSSPVQQRQSRDMNLERTSSEDSGEGEGGSSPRKRRRLDINEMLQR